MAKRSIGKPKDGAISNTEKAELRKKELEFVENVRSSSSEKIKVQIDPRTWICISPDRDPEVARKRFIEVYGAERLQLRHDF